MPIVQGDTLWASCLLIGISEIKNGKKMSQIANGIASSVIALFANFAMGATSFDGEWDGKLRCGMSQTNPDETQAFSHPISMTVTGKTAKITRNTNAIAENSIGKITGNGQASFSGDGHFKDPARKAIWTTVIEGRFTTGRFSGNLEIYNKNGKKSRDCVVELTQVAQENAKVSQKLEAPTVVSVSKPEAMVGTSKAPPVNLDIPAPKPTVPAQNSRPPTEQLPATPVIASTPVTTEVQPAMQPQQVEKTLTGSMKWGATDNCLEVQDDKKTTCYGFGAQGAVSAVLVGACNQGSKCTVTGTFDDEKGLLVSVTKAVPLLGDSVSPTAQQKLVVAAPVANAPTIQPSSDILPTKRSYGAGISLAIAMIGLIVGVAIFIRKRRKEKSALQPQTIKPESPASVVAELTKHEMSLPSPLAIHPTSISADKTYQVVINGVQPNISLLEAKTKLAALFKATPEQIEKLLATPANIVKKAIPLEAATKYKNAIEAAGGVCDVIPEEEVEIFLEVDLPNFLSTTPEAKNAEGNISSTTTIKNKDAQAIWNPKATARWSVLFTPVFGSYLQMLNWQAIGEPEKASTARTWFYSSLAVGVIFTIISALLSNNKSAEGAVQSLPLWFYLAWYYATGRSQDLYVKNKFGTEYKRRAWTKALLVATSALLAYLLVIGVYVVVTEEKDSPPKAQASESGTAPRQDENEARATDCETRYVNAKFPVAWSTAYYLADVNTPEPFQKSMCTYMGRGARVRYLAGGMFSDEGFEVKSKARTIQVFMEAQRVPGGDPKIPLMVPVSVKIDGEKITITRENYRTIQAELIVAMLNK